MRSLPTTLAAGYLAIAVQTLTGLFLIPFLVSEDGVGLTGFAAIVTLQAAVGLVAIIFDGYRQYAARVIALATNNGDREVLSSVFHFTLFAATAAVVPWLMASPLVSKLTGIHTEDVVTASFLAAACVVVEQLSYVLECHQHATRRSWVPSCLGGLDSLLRAILIVVLFKSFSANVSQFFLAALLGQTVKFSILLWLSPIEVRLLGGKWIDRMISQCKAFAGSLSLALNGIAPFIVFKGSVILANVTLAGEQAGVIAIILVTLRGYFNQGLFSVLRPMLIPRLALVDTRDRTSTYYRRLITYLDLFQVTILFVGILAVVSTPVWFSLWLGSSVKDYAVLAQIAVAIYFLEIAYGAQYSCLIAHNNGRSLALLTGFFALIATTTTAVVAYNYPSAAFYAGPVMAYLLLYVLAVRIIFGKYFDFPLQQSDRCTVLFVVAICVGISLIPIAEEMSGLPSLFAGALFLGLAYAMGIRISIDLSHFPVLKRGTRMHSS